MKKFLSFLFFLSLFFLLRKQAFALGPDQFNCDWNPGTLECYVSQNNCTSTPPDENTCKSITNEPACKAKINVSCKIGSCPAPDPTQTCAYVPQGCSAPAGYTIKTTYEFPDASSGITVGGSQCTNPVDGLTPGNPYDLYCKTEKDSCSIYRVRAPLCGSSDEAELGCTFSTDGAYLSCWGNNYRRCDPTLEDFPDPKEGQAKRQGFLLSPQKNWTPYLLGAKKYSGDIYYNGEKFTLSNQAIWFCDANVTACGPGFEQEIGGEGESRLWYPHLRLIAMLSSLAQSIFNPGPTTLINQTTESQTNPDLTNPAVVTTRIEKHQGIDDSTNVVNTITTSPDGNNSSLIIGEDLLPDLAEQYLTYSQDPYKDAQCVVPGVINNPGDDLLGPKITGRAYYTNRFEYEALTTIGCVADGGFCLTGGTSCCSKKACAVDSTGIGICPVADPVRLTARGRVDPFVKNPLVEYIYDTLINGEGSVFKRFMPEVATKKFDEIPSSVTYTANAQAANGTGELKEFDTGEGTTPYFYVPHVGSLEKYWLEDLQKALRPQGITNGTIGIEPTDGEKASCNRSGGVWEGVPKSGFPASIAQIMDIAATKYKIPVCLLSGVASVEGSRMRTLTDAEAIALTKKWTGPPLQNVSQELLDKVNCQPNFAGASGPMQMLPSAFNPHANASNSYLGQHTNSVCNATDAIFAAAELIAKDKLPAYGYDDSSSNNVARKYCATGEGYYGSCQMDDITCNNLGTNYCDFILTYCKNEQPELNIGEGQCSDYFDTTRK